MIKLKNLTAEETAQLLPTESMVLLGWRGSVAHGMYVPANNPDSIDDKDIMGVYVAPIEHYLGFGRQEVVERFIGEWDAVSYELKKFIWLLLKQNPNVLSLLWLGETGYLFKHEIGAQLIANRHIFLSKSAYYSFSGYAHGQLKRMTHLNQEALADINRRAVQIVEQGATVDADTGEAKLPAGASAELQNAVNQYAGLRSKYFSGYMGNKRKKLVEQHGYDTKNAAHLIRILRMGIEYLTDGRLHVEREDKQELLAIKRGEWTLERVQQEAERMFVLAQEAFVRSTLPAQPDQRAAEQLCMGLIADFYGLKV